MSVLLISTQMMSWVNYFSLKCTNLKNIYLAVDYDYVHKELSKPGVNLKLLWKEYCLSAKDGKYPVSYSKYCRGYAQHVERHNYTNHIEHKPGIRTEIDWSGPTMHYMVPSTG